MSRDDNAQVRAIAATAARVMPGWTAANEEYRAYLNGPDGARLHLHQPWNRKGHVSVTGVYPRTSARTDHSSVMVRMDRGAGVLAREIQRRLLPGYLACLAKVAGHNAAEQHNTALRLALASKITAMFPGDLSCMPGHCQGDRRTEVIVSLGGLLGGHVKTHGDGSEVEFERFRVPADVALAMLAIVTEMPARTEAS